MIKKRSTLLGFLACVLLCLSAPAADRVLLGGKRTNSYDSYAEGPRPIPWFRTNVISREVVTVLATPPVRFTNAYPIATNVVRHLPATRKPSKRDALQPAGAPAFVPGRSTLSVQPRHILNDAEAKARGLPPPPKPKP